MSDLRINWGKISTFISIISALATLATAFPFFLSFYFGNDWLAKTIDRQKLANNAKGFVYYKPPLNGNLGDNTAYYVLKKEQEKTNNQFTCKMNPKDTKISTNVDAKNLLINEPNAVDTFCNLGKDDILSTSQDSFMRESSNFKSRIKFIVRPDACVQVMEEPQKQNLVAEIDPKSRQGGWITVAVRPCPTDLK